MNNNAVPVTLLIVALIGVIGYLAYDNREKENATVGNQVEEVAEEIGDEVDDAVSGNENKSVGDKVSEAVDEVGDEIDDATTGDAR